MARNRTWSFVQHEHVCKQHVACSESDATCLLISCVRESWADSMLCIAAATIISVHDSSVCTVCVFVSTSYCVRCKCYLYQFAECVIQYSYWTYAESCGFVTDAGNSAVVNASQWSCLLCGASIPWCFHMVWWLLCNASCIYRIDQRAVSCGSADYCVSTSSLEYDKAVSWSWWFDDGGGGGGGAYNRL